MSLLHGRALGLLETRGLVAAVEAADALGKAADVELIHVRRVGAGRVCVLFAGELGSCQAALEAGAAAATALGDLTGHRILARPLRDLDALLGLWCICPATAGAHAAGPARAPRKRPPRRNKATV